MLIAILLQWAAAMVILTAVALHKGLPGLAYDQDLKVGWARVRLPNKELWLERVPVGAGYAKVIHFPAAPRRQGKVRRHRSQLQAAVYRSIRQQRLGRQRKAKSRLLAGLSSADSPYTADPDLERRRQRLIADGTRYMAGVKAAITSSADSQLWLTLKVFPSSDNSLLGWDLEGVHSQMLKLAFVADDQWASAFNKHWTQLIGLTGSLLGEEGAAKLRDSLDFEDVIFVQNLKDQKGRDVAVDYINEIMTTLGYAPITPGFWIKERDERGNLKPLAQWYRSLFNNNKDLRSRARGASTTPIVADLNVDADGTPIQFFVGDFERTGQHGADGGNDYSYDLDVVGLNEAVAQLRVHTPFFAGLEEDKLQGFQLKGQMHAAKVHAIKEDGRWYRHYGCDGPAATAVAAVFVHYDNVKGSLGDYVAQRVSELEGNDEVLNLNDLWYEKAGLELVPQDMRQLLGGVIAQDNRNASSSVSWQDTILRNPASMKGMETSWRNQLFTQIKRLYTSNSEVYGQLFGDARLEAAASAMAGMNPRRVEHIVFGAGRKMATKYCEQIEMPKQYVISGGIPTRDVAFGSDGDASWPVVTLTGQPQLYHHALATARVVSHADLKRAFIVASMKVGRQVHGVTVANDAVGEEELSRAEQFYDDFKAHLQRYLKSEYGEDLEGDDLDWEVYYSLRSIWISVDCSPNLIWMSKELQDQLQRDSDGDRILFSFERWVVQSVRLHEEAIRNLPMPKPEVSKKTPFDGNKAVMEACPFSYEKVSRADVFKYICAPNQGQGPTGFLVNLCSAVLAHIAWQDENGRWEPDSRVRENALRFYAFMVLLVQNGIDRQKKPWTVASLIQWFKTDWSELMEKADGKVVGGEHYAAANMTEGFPSMEIGELVAQHKTRLNVDEQYNIPALKLFVAWGLSFINAGYAFDKDSKWSDDLQKVAKVFSDSSDESPVDWEKVANLTASDLTATELENSWVWPDRLYGWKSEASLEVPLHDAPPALNLLSQWAVDEHGKVKEEFDLNDTQVERVIFADYMLNHKHKGLLEPLGGKATATAFAKALMASYSMGKAQENASMAQSEFYLARGENDANHYLDLLKDALRDVEFEGQARNLLWTALLGGNGSRSKQEKTQAVKITAEFFRALWAETGYDSWLLERKPLTYLAKQVAEGLDLHEVVSSEVDGENLSPAEKVAVAVFDALGFSPTGNRMKTLPAELGDLLKTAWLGKAPIGSSLLEALKGVGPTKSRAVGAALAEITLPTEKAHWAEVIWSDWMPALDVQVKLAEDTDARKKHFVDGEGLNNILVALEGDTSPAAVKQLFLTLYRDLCFSIFREEVLEDGALNDEDYAEMNDLCPTEHRFALMLGYLKRKGKFPTVRQLMTIGRPYMQGLRLKRVVEIQLPELLADKAEFSKYLRGRLFDEKPYTYQVNGETKHGVNRQLRGRLEYPLSNDLVSELAGRVAQKHSFYLLQNTRNLWVNKRGEPQLTCTKRWIAHDRLQYMVEGVDPVQAIKCEIENRTGVGHIFSAKEIGLLSEIFKENSSGDFSDISAYLDGKLSRTNLSCTWSYDEPQLADLDLNARLANELCFPYHWGGNFKARKSRYGHRSSAYRPIWRFIMSLLPDGSATSSETLKQQRFALFEQLSGASLKPGGGAKKVETISDLVREFSNADLNSNKKSKSRLPSVNPVGPLVSHNGSLEWVKPLKAPMSEEVCHLSYRDGTTASLWYDLNGAGHPQVISLDGDSEPMTDAWRDRALRDSLRNPELLKLNGVFTSRRCLEELLLVEGLVGSHFEYALGLMHATSLVDSYVLSNWHEHSARVASKTPSALRRFFRVGQGAQPGLELPDSAYLKALIHLNIGGE